jgi:hypothetical protein
VNIDLTTGDFDLKARGMQVGSQVSYNAIVSKCVSVTADGNTLKLPTGSEPVADYGMNAAYAYVTGGDNNGQAYLIGDDGAIENFVAISGTTYTVQYFERQANAQALPISAMFAPGVYHVTAQMAVYSTNGGNGENRGSQVGWAYMIIPRMQFSGNASTNGSQTDAATTVLSGTALSYEEAAQEGVCQDCLYPNLAYMTYVPMSLADGSITGLAVVGGGVDLTAGATAVLPVKFVMRDNSLVQPNYSQLTYDVEDDSVATVGTINMDYRSFYFHFECGTWICGNQTVTDIREFIETLFEKSEEITLDKWKKRPMLKKLKEQVLHLFAPFM